MKRSPRRAGQQRTVLASASTEPEPRRVTARRSSASDSLPELAAGLMIDPPLADQPGLEIEIVDARAGTAALPAALEGEDCDDVWVIDIGGADVDGQSLAAIAAAVAKLPGVDACRALGLRTEDLIAAVDGPGGAISDLIARLIADHQRDERRARAPKRARRRRPRRN
jgi:hypothetical protein